MSIPTAAGKAKLLIVVSYFPPYISGLTLYAAQLAKLLAHQYDVTVLTGQHDPELPRHSTVGGYCVIRAPLLFRLHKGYVSVAFIRQFIRLAKEADVINLHVPMLEAGLLSRLIAGKKLLLTFQCDPVYDKGLFDRVAVGAVQISARVAAQRSHAIVVLSEDYASCSRSVRGVSQKIVELSPPCRFEGCQPVRVPTFTANPSIGFVGRFVPEKGLPILLDVWPNIIRLYPEAKLFLAGNYRAVAGGSMFSAIESKISTLPGVEVLGELSDASLWQLYSSLDVLVLPSLNAYEAFGMVQIEAMSAGALVVASDLPGVRVPILRTGNGMLVEPGNAVALEQGIKAVLLLRCRKTRSAVQQATIRHFSSHSFQDGYASLLNGMHRPHTHNVVESRLQKNKKAVAS